MKKTDAFTPRDLSALSVDELNDYISDLQAEITRVTDNIAAKKQSQDAAASVFKS